MFPSTSRWPDRKELAKPSKKLLRQAEAIKALKDEELEEL